MAYTPSTIYSPQYAAAAGVAALALFPRGGSAIAAGQTYQINTAWVANNSTIGGATATPYWLELYRVPSGGTANATTFLERITVPASTLANPNVPLSCLWGIQLNPGDTIWALAQTASKLVIQADGGINTP